MATGDLQAMLDQSNVISGVLVVHCQGGDERYEISKVPALTASLVQAAKEEILMTLTLDSMLTNLNRTSDLLYLAYMSVIGIGTLQGRISKRQKDLSDLCGECLKTMSAFERESREVLQNLAKAYSFLLEAKEERALRILSRCAENSKAMSTKCKELADAFGKMKADTKEDAERTAEVWGDQVEKIDKLNRIRADMAATKKKQEALTVQINKDLTELKIQMAKEEAKLKSSEMRGFLLGIVGVFSGAMGGLGGLAVELVRFLANSRGTDQKGNSSLPGGKGGVGNDKKWEEVLAIAQKALTDKKRAAEEAEEKKDTANREERNSRVENETNRSILEEAKKAIYPSEAEREEKVREAQTAFDASSAIYQRVLGEQKKAQADLEKAQAASKAAAEDSAALKLSKEESDRSKQLTTNLMDMLQKKSDQETLRREAVSQVAELTSRLESNVQFIKVEQSAQTALEIATWALDNIFAALSDAKLFWDSMEIYCGKMAKPDVIRDIKEEIEFDGSSDEKRIQFYKSTGFIHVAIKYLCQWAALVNVCGEYVLSSARTRDSVLGKIKASPNTEEAKKLVGPLRKQLLEELAQDEIEINKIVKKYDQALKPKET